MIPLEVQFGFSLGPGQVAGVISKISMAYPDTATVEADVLVDQRILGRDGNLRNLGHVGAQSFRYSPADFAPGAHLIPRRIVATNAIVPGEFVDLARLQQDTYSVAIYEIERGRTPAPAPEPAPNPE